MSFHSFGLSQDLILSLEKKGFKNPTEIQNLAIPKILQGSDLLIESPTGTGKTASFVIPILEKLQRGDLPLNQTSVLVISPTRELALQTALVFEKLAKGLPFKIKTVAIIGGESIKEQNDLLSQGAEVIIATPGRLLDLLRQKTVDLTALAILVLDEADKILDLGFAQELEEVLSQLPSQRQNLFFSATYPQKINNLVKKISDSTEIIKLEQEEGTPLTAHITQRVIEVHRDKRTALLRHLYQSENWHRLLVFVSSKIAARNLASKLKKYDINAESLHGDLSQTERNFVLSEFKQKNISVLIATDIAARGIDILKLPLVVNFDLPRSPTDYIHRIGRTGRAGEKGLAISFISFEDFDHFKLIEKRAKIKLERESIPGFELTGLAPQKIKGAAPIKGKRKSKKDKLRQKNAKENKSTI